MLFYTIESETSRINCWQTAKYKLCRMSKWSIFDEESYFYVKMYFLSCRHLDLK